MNNYQKKYFILSKTEFNLTISDRMDLYRIDSSETEIDAFYYKLKEAVEGVIAIFNNNLDEVRDVQEIAAAVNKLYKKTRFLIVFVRQKRSSDQKLISHQMANRLDLCDDNSIRLTLFFFYLILYNIR